MVYDDDDILFDLIPTNPFFQDRATLLLSPQLMDNRGQCKDYLRESRFENEIPVPSPLLLRAGLISDWNTWKIIRDTLPFLPELFMYQPRSIQTIRNS